MSKTLPPVKKTVEEKFNRMVRLNQQVYKCKDAAIIAELQKRITLASINNAEIGEQIRKAYSKPEYRCNTCGVKDSQHPLTGYCFNCDTDNWHRTGERYNQSY
jgi:hypothetical protein